MLATIAGLLLATTLPARTQTLTTLYSFSDSDGRYPESGVVWGPDGNLYGSTAAAGAYGDGTLFRMTPAGTLTTLHTFSGYPSDGEFPQGRLTFDSQGNVYGTTNLGGSKLCISKEACGTAFKLTPAGDLAVLHSFFFNYPPSMVRQGPWVTDGTWPSGGVVRDAQGNLYGATQNGGTYDPAFCFEFAACFGNGVVFKIAPDGSETILHYFTQANDGGNPRNGIIADSAGNLYGTTFRGGQFGKGTVFKITPQGALTTLYTFTESPFDGQYPNGDLVMDAKGNLYGTTMFGGTAGYGSVFEVSPNGAEKLLYSFQGAGQGADAANPNGGLVLDAQGNLYGTSIEGIYFNCFNLRGCGTIFKITPGGTETLLYVFSGDADGWYPNGNLVFDSEGNLYGTTVNGGNFSGSCNVVGCGTIFKLTP